MTKTKMPLNHFRHLKRLADLRRCSLPAALDFMMECVEPADDNWLDERWPDVVGTRDIDIGSHEFDLVLRKIQGLPRNIRAITDGPYLEEFSFFDDEPGLIGIEADGVRLLDFEVVTRREEQVYPLVKDMLPAMTLAQYRVYNMFNSQYLRVRREARLFTMPRKQAPAIDAGCYVGYKAFAMARFIGKYPVLAFELTAENIAVLERNVGINPHLNVKPIRAALSNKVEDMVIHTRNRRTMAHSLTRFEDLKEGGAKLGTTADASETIQTSRLDDYTRSMGELSAVHVSVNGHEPEVVLGAQETARKADILRVSCPYVRGGRPIRGIVAEAFEAFDVPVHGVSGAAVIAGRDLGDYHAQPMS